MLARPTVPVLSQPEASRLPQRLAVLAAVLILESLTLAQFPHPWFFPQQVLAAPIVFAATLLFFGRKRLHTLQPQNQPIASTFLVLHLLAVAAVAASEFVLLRAPSPTLLPLAGWYISLVLLVASLLAALFPSRQLTSMARALGSAWLYAALTTAVAMSARALARSSWDATDSRIGHALQQATFAGVRTLLGFFYAPVISIPSRAILGTVDFHVQVAGACSGIEGLALIFVLTVGWLIFARKELRLARAIWLVPIALAATWVLNLSRIAALIAIGASGHPAIAGGGFHSEAGWILLNAVAIAFLAAAQNIAWFRRPVPILTALPGTAANAAASPGLTTSQTANAYLLPFLAIVATSLLTQAFSNGFETLYALRLLVGLAVLWHFRAVYRTLDWRITWLAPAAGVFIFALWIAIAHVASSPTSGPDKTALALALLAPWQRILWLATRALAAVVTVPIAEELAFRGYLARIFVAPDVSRVSYQQLTLSAILLSSVIFGALHGRLAIAGFFAGLVFALVAKRRGRLSEAIAAHATANLLLTLWVFTTNHYDLW